MRTLIGALAVFAFGMIAGLWVFHVYTKGTFESADYSVALWIALFVAIFCAPKRNDNSAIASALHRPD